MKLPIAFLIAVQFLTRLPVRLAALPSPVQLGRSLLWYPLVGVLMGALLWGLSIALGAVSPLLAAAIVLVVWVALTGALHLDGLADSTDAWVGGMGDPARTLAIMKDPCSGPMAVAVLVGVLLLKFAALTVLLPAHGYVLLLLPMLARAYMLLLFRQTPYVRANGLGQALSEHLPRRASTWVLALCVVGVLLVNPGLGLWLLLVSVLVYGLLRRAMLKRLQGFTGDTAGALIELLECALLLSCALYLG